MKKDEKLQKNTQFLAFSVDEAEIPQFIERSYSGKEW